MLENFHEQNPRLKHYVPCSENAITNKVKDMIQKSGLQGGKAERMACTTRLTNRLNDLQTDSPTDQDYVAAGRVT